MKKSSTTSTGKTFQQQQPHPPPHKPTTTTKRNGVTSLSPPKSGGVTTSSKKRKATLVNDGKKKKEKKEKEKEKTVMVSPTSPKPKHESPIRNNKITTSSSIEEEILAKSDGDKKLVNAQKRNKQQLRDVVDKKLNTFCEAKLLVGLNDSGEFYIVEETAKQIASLRRFGVVVITGPIRTGKSTLGALLWGIKFQTSNQSKSCTKGIWYAEKVFKGKNTNYIVLDTEGLGATDYSNEKHDVKLFALSLLMSDLLLYNVKTTLDAHALETLGSIVGVSQKVCLRSADEFNSSVDTLTTTASTINPKSDIHKLIGQVIFVIRDSFLTHDYSTPKEWLDAELQPSKPKIPSSSSSSPSLSSSSTSSSSSSPSTETTSIGIYNIRKQQIQDGIPSEKRDCIFLPLPVKSTIPTSLSTLPLDDDKWNQDFLNGIQKLRSQIEDKLEPKTLFGVRLQGVTFISLLRSYVNCLNSDKVTSVSDEWKKHADANFAKAAEQVAKVHQKMLTSISRIISKHPLLQSDLILGLRLGKDYLFKRLLEDVIEDGEEYHKKSENLRKQLENAEEEILKANCKKISESAEKVLKTVENIQTFIFSQIMADIGTSSFTISTLPTIITKIKEILHSSETFDEKEKEKDDGDDHHHQDLTQLLQIFDRPTSDGKTVNAEFLRLLLQFPQNLYFWFMEEFNHRAWLSGSAVVIEKQKENFAKQRITFCKQRQRQQPEQRQQTNREQQVLSCADTLLVWNAAIVAASHFPPFIHEQSLVLPFFEKLQQRIVLSELAHAELKQKHDQMQKLESTLAESKTILDQEHQKLAAVKSELKVKEFTLEQITKEKENLQEQLIQIQTDLDGYEMTKSQLIEISEKYSHTISNFGRLQKENEFLKQKCGELQDQVLRQNAEMQTMQRRLEDNTKELEKAKQCEQELESCKQDLQKSETKSIEQKRRYDIQKTESDTLKKSWEDFKSQYGDNKNWKNKHDILSRKVANLQKQMAELERQKQEKTMLIQQLEEQLKTQSGTSIFGSTAGWAIGSRVFGFPSHLTPPPLPSHSPSSSSFIASSSSSPSSSSPSSSPSNPITFSGGIPGSTYNVVSTPSTILKQLPSRYNIASLGDEDDDDDFKL